MSNEEFPRLSHSMSEWQMAIRRSGRQDFAEKLTEDKMANLRKLEVLELPHYKQIEMPLQVFLENPESAFDLVPSEKYFVVVASKDDSLRDRSVNLSKREVIQFVSNAVPANFQERCRVSIQEYLENKYGGNIVIEKDGTILVEMIKGFHGELVGGKKTPEYTMCRKNTGNFSFSFEDPGLRRILYDTLLCIPHHEDDMSSLASRANIFTPGYYEFILVQRDESKNLEPIFLDYSANPIFRTTPRPN